MAKKKYEDYLKELQEKSKKLEYKPQVYTHSLEKKAVVPIKKASDVNTISDIYNFANNNQKSYSQQAQDYKKSLIQTQKDANKLRNIANKFDLDLNGVRFEAPTKRSIMNRDISAPIYNRHNKNTVIQNPVEKTKQANKELNRQILAYKGNIENSKELKDYNERKDKINAVLEYSMNVAKNRENTTNKGKYTSSFIGNMGNTLIPFRNQFKTEKGDAVVLPNYNQIRASQFKENLDSGLYKAYSDLTGSLGNMVPGILAGTVSGGLGGAVFGANTFTTARNQALLEGYDGSSASTYGIVNAGLELGIGKLLGGASAIMGKSPIAKEIGSKFTSKFMSNPTMASLTADMISEFGEEYVQEWLDPKVRAYLLEHKDIVESWKSSDFLSKENFYAGLLGSLSAGVMNTPNAIRNQSNLNNQIDSIVTNIENNTETKLSKEEKQSIRKSFYDEYNKAIKTNTEINYDNIVQNTGLPVTNKPILPGLNTNNQYSMQDMTMNNNNTYQYVKSDNSKIDNLRRSASKQKFNNSEQTTNFINMLEKIVSDKDIDIVFDSTLSNNVNGKYENGIITINPNSSRVGEFIAVHELTHAIGTDSMRKIVDNYRNSNPQFESALQNILKNYNTTELTDEAMADVAGQLFGNQEFINNLSQTNPSLFKRIYNEIKYLWHQFTGYKNQNQFIEDLQYKWEQAYRNNSKLNQSNNLSKQTDNIGKYVNIDVNQSQFDNLTLEQQRKLAKEILDKKYNGMINEDVALSKRGIKEYTNPQEKISNSKKRTKYRLSTELDNLYDVSKKINKELIPNDNSHKYHDFAKDGWNYYYARFKFGNKEFIGKINEGIADGKPSFYNVTDIHTPLEYKKMTENGTLNKNESALIQSFIEDNISQKDTNVNDTSSTKYSIQETQNNTQELDNSSFFNTKYSLTDNQGRTTSEELTKRIYEIKNQREELRQQLFELRQERNDITASIPNYSMFKQYDELNDVNKRMDNNKNLSKELYAELQELETKIEEVKEQEKNERIAKEEAEATPHKLAQNRIIQETNPMLDDYHTGIRSVGDIKTWQEAMSEAERLDEGYSWGDFSKEDAQKALKRGKIRVYSSYAIKNGTFVSTSYQQALDYAGGERSKVHSREVALDSVAWISVDEGQYAKVYNTKYSLNEAPKQDNQGRELSIQQQEYFKDSKERDADGSLKEMYHGTKNYGFTVFDRKYAKSSGNFGTGIYFAPTQDYSNAYGEMYKVYLNIKNPVDAINKQRTLTNEQVKKLVEAVANNEDYGIENYGYNATVESVTNDLIQHNNDFEIFQDLDITCVGDFVKLVELSNEVLGTNFDGIRTPLESIVFNSNQIKDVDNTNPTSDADIRYSKNNATWQEYLEDNFEASGTRTNMEDIKLPIKKSKVPLSKQLSNENIEISKQKTMNPSEISKLTKEDASSTPKLPTKKNVNKVGDGNSKFFDNILFKTDMLDSNSKKLILSDEDVKYYDKVTNKESLEKAFNKINNGGSAEVLNWNNKFQLDSEGKTKSTATSTDIAEGWILMKQYQDAGDYDSMVQIAKTMRQIGTQAGQTIQAFNILERMTPEGMVKYAQSELSEAYDRMVKNKSREWIDKHQKDFDLNPQEVAFIIDTMEEVSRMKDGYDKRVKLAEIQKLMTDKLPPEKGAGIKSWMRISMLFNPKTQVRNVLGNAVIAPVNYFSDLVSTVADKAISNKTGVRTTASTNLKQYAKGFKKGLYESYNDFKKGINTRDMQGNRFEIGQGKSFNNNNKIGKSLNRVDSLLSFMLDAGDRGFYEASFTNSINNQMKINKTTEVTQEMIDIATQEALSRTWQDNNNYTKFVLDIRKGLNKLNVKGYGLGDVLIPFAKTPANLTKAIVDYSPLGLVSTINDGVRLNKSLNNGQYNAQMQHKFVQNLGKALAGSMLYIVGYALAKSEVISGESDDDKDIANFMKNTLGISNYSIKIGNKSFTYDWAQPIATPLTIMANYQKNKEEGASLHENITSVLDTGLNVLFEQSFLESLSDFLSNPGEMGTKLQEQLLELPSRAVPTFMKQIADMVDGTTRTTFEKNKPLATAVNKVKAKLPGVSKTLASSTDTIGREIQKYGGNNNIFNVFLNPANINTENISESAQEIYKIYKATGEKSVMPRVPEYSYKDKDGNEIKFTASDRSKFSNESGKVIDKEIANLMKTPEYKSMSNIEKAEIIKSIVDYSYNIAKNKVTGIELSDSYEKAYNYSKIGNVSDYYLFKESIDVTTKDTKKTSIVNYLLDSDLEDKQIAYLYDIYYSSPETLNNIINANIPMKEYIKFNSVDIEGEFDESKGRTKTNSKKNETIKYVNSLKLSIPQKAFLIRTKYKTYNDYDKNIVNYINKQNIGKLDKYKLIKEVQIDSYDKEIVRYVNSQSMTSKEKQDLLKEMGFTVRNGRVYY